MRTIKIYLAESGSIAELQKDFPLYQGSYNNKLLNVYVPKSILGNTLDTQYIDETGFVHTEPGTFSALKIGMTYLQEDGRVSKTTAFYMRYLKTIMYNNVEYALYERQLPSAFTVYAGQGESASTLIINAVNMENNNELVDEEIVINLPTILEIITSQTCKLDVLESTGFDADEAIEASEWEVVNAKIDDLYFKYDTLNDNISLMISDYTYSKVVIDEKDTTVLETAQIYTDNNFYKQTDADNRFVHLTGNETIADTKTFSASPIVPDATANTHTINRQSMYNYTYSKTEANNIATGMTVDTYAHFIEWIAGTYTDVTPAGTIPADFLIGKKVYILEADKNNYRCINIPVTSISDF